MKWSFVNLADVLKSAEVFVDGDWVESKDQDVNGDVRFVWKTLCGFVVGALQDLLKNILAVILTGSK